MYICIYMIYLYIILFTLIYSRGICRQFHHCRSTCHRVQEAAKSIDLRYHISLTPKMAEKAEFTPDFPFPKPTHLKGPLGWFWPGGLEIEGKPDPAIGDVWHSSQFRRVFPQKFCKLGNSIIDMRAIRKRGDSFFTLVKNITWNLNITHWKKEKRLPKPSFLKFHVDFPECISILKQVFSKKVFGELGGCFRIG